MLRHDLPTNSQRNISLKKHLRHVPWDSGSTSQSPWKWTCWSPVASIQKSSDLFRGFRCGWGWGSIPGKRNDVLNNSFLESWWHWRLGFLCLLLEHKTGPIYSDGIGWYWMVLDVLNVDSKLKLLLPWSVKPYNMILDRFSRLIRKISVLKGKLFDEVNCTSFTHWEYRLTLTCKRVEQELFDWNFWFEFIMEEVGFWPVDDFTDCSFRGVLPLYMQQSVDISR